MGYSSLHACRTGPGHSAEPAGEGVRPTDSNAGEPLDSVRVSLHNRHESDALRDGTMDERCNPCEIGWAAASLAGQSSRLRTERHRGYYSDDTNAGKGTVMNIDYPYHFDSRGRTAEAGGDVHIRDMIEQVLFTNPGERVNRPAFGSGLLQLVFAPLDDALSGAVQMSVQGALQQWLGDLIRVEGVQVESEDSTIRVLVQYTILKTRQRQTAQFERGV